MRTNRNASKRASSQPSKRITNIGKNQRIGKYIANNTHEKKNSRDFGGSAGVFFTAGVWLAADIRSVFP